MEVYHHSDKMIVFSTSGHNIYEDITKIPRINYSEPKHDAAHTIIGNTYAHTNTHTHTHNIRTWMHVHVQIEKS